MAACIRTHGSALSRRTGGGLSRRRHNGNEEDMTAWKVLAVGVLAAAASAAWVQKNSIGKLRQQNAELRQQAELASENRPATPVPADNDEMQNLTEATRDLP